jgi:hypothetical protein
LWIKIYLPQIAIDKTGLYSQESPVTLQLPKKTKIGVGLYVPIKFIHFLEIYQNFRKCSYSVSIVIKVCINKKDVSKETSTLKVSLSHCVSFEWPANQKALSLKNALILFWRFGEFVEIWNELITWKSSWCALIPKRWTFNIRLASWGYTKSIFT